MVLTPIAASFSNSLSMNAGDQKRMLGELAETVPSALLSRLTMLIMQKSHLNLQPSEV